MTDVEQKSVELKQNLNNLADMVNDSGITIAMQHLKNAMRRWGDAHRCLVAEQEQANRRRDQPNDRTWAVFTEDRELLRRSIGDLRGIAMELDLDMGRVSEDATLREAS